MPLLFPNHKDGLATEASYKIRISLVARLDMILPFKQRTKALIRQRGCTGSSVPLMFANPEDRFSFVKVHLMKVQYTVKPVLSGHSKRRPKLVFKTNYRLMQAKSIAECSKGSILQYF